MILEKLTFKRFGYYPRDLLPKSGKKILAACDDCGKVRITTKQHYAPRCRNCSRSYQSGSRPILNRMYRFEDLYGRFFLGCISWEMVIDELNKKAKRGNPYALNIWRVFDKDFTHSKKVRSAIDLYFDSFKRMEKAP